MRWRILILIAVFMKYTATSYGAWSVWTKCSVTCGEGFKIRKRPCEPFELGCNAGSSVKEKKECRLTPCGGLACFEGISGFIGGLEVINTFQIRKCKDIHVAPKPRDGTSRTGLFCAMTSMKIERGGVTVDMLQGTCLNDELCRSVNCKEYGKMMGLYNIKSCDVRCCQKDWCNNPSRHSEKLISPTAEPDPCADNPCKNFGSCVTLPRAEGKLDYICACPPEYRGKNCTEAAARICHTGVSARSVVAPVGTPMLPTTCADVNDSCMVATVAAYVDGAAVYIDTAQCAKAVVCDSLTCNDLRRTMPSYDVSACKIVCCDEDYCNTAPMNLPPPPTTTPYTTKRTTSRKRMTTKKTKTAKPSKRTRKPSATNKPQKTTRKSRKTTTTTTAAPSTTVNKSGPHWSEWQKWQPCTHACGDHGIRRRYRFCMKGAPGMPGCLPQNGVSEEEPCNTGTSCIRWREWGHWQSCSRSCGGGTHERRRSCDGGAPNTGDCIGDEMEQNTCNEQPCDQTAKWRDWGQWQSCSRSCGGGTHERRRSCDGGAPNTGGCIGNEIEQKSCSVQSCEEAAMATTTTISTSTTAATSTTPVITRPGIAKPKKGWDQWSDWDTCSASCGLGTQRRIRKCIGGRPGRRGCRGSPRQTQDCNAGQCAAPTSVTTTIETITKDSKRKGWSNWSNWGLCSATCGQGSMVRSRECVGGRINRRGCRGKKNEKKKCETPCEAPTAITRAKCMQRDLELANKSDRKCSFECFSDSNCEENEKCLCDGPCGRTCQTTLETAPSGSECMTRDLQVARISSRRCPFECFSDGNCDGNEKCVCDGPCGKTCQDTSKKCINILSADLDGTIMTCSSDVFVGSKCTFSCETGYKLEGKPDVFCQGTTKWTNQKNLPECVAATVSATKLSPTCKFRYKNQDACCGNIPYNSMKNKCCEGKVSRAGPAMRECCGKSPYNPSNKGCCREKLFTLSYQACQSGDIVSQ